MPELSLPSPAKINLFLHITGQRENGYHNLQTVFQLLDYGDTLHFKLNDFNEIRFQCNRPELESPDNLVMKAANLLYRETGKITGTTITLDKNLPAGGGLGGGSSNAATTLLALNRLWHCGLETEDLASLGLQLGADVPVFIHGHSAWAEGLGEQIQPISLPQRWYVVITPPCHVSTSEIFSHEQLTRNTLPITIPGFPFPGCRNDCENLAKTLYPEINKALEWLGQFGEARMTGTGSSIFAGFDSKEAAEAVLEQNWPDKPEGLQSFIARGVNISPCMKALF